MGSILYLSCVILCLPSGLDRAIYLDSINYLPNIPSPFCYFHFYVLIIIIIIIIFHIFFFFFKYQNQGEGKNKLELTKKLDCTSTWVAFLATSHKGLTSKGGEEGGGGRAKIILQRRPLCTKKLRPTSLVISCQSRALLVLKALTSSLLSLRNKTRWMVCCSETSFHHNFKQTPNSCPS